MSFLKYGDQNCTLYSRCGLTKPLYRGKIMFPILEEIVIPIYPNILLAFDFPDKSYDFLLLSKQVYSLQTWIAEKYNISINKSHPDNI